MTTIRLASTDAFLPSFDAAVVLRTTFAGKPSVVLDRTAFYAEGGGQLGDTGTLHFGEVALVVVDTQVDDEGRVHHLYAGDAPVGDAVHGTIDWARRRDHMSQHTGQHALSAALARSLGAETVSSRLGADSSTIDVDAADLSDQRLASVEDEVNDLVLADVPVRTFFPTEDELRALPLRRAPKVATGIRVVEIEGFDVSPCGGTHVARSGQIGVVRITGRERHKGGTRVTFLAGRRALLDARAKEATLASLAKQFSCAPADVPLAVGKREKELAARTDDVARARGELARLLASARLAASPPSGATARLAVVHDGLDVPTLRTLAGALAKRPDVAALAASRDPATGDFAVVVERGAEAAFDAGAWLKDAAKALGGRGGGRPDRAEGRISGSVDLRAHFEASSSEPPR